MHYMGSKKQGYWVDGCLQADGCELRFPVLDGIPMFVDSKDDPWSNEEEVEASLAKQNIDRNSLIRKNWERMLGNRDKRDEYNDWVRAIADQRGLILEVACGPGGGLAPLILDSHPEATLLMNDIGRWILQEWKRLSDTEQLWPNISFAQFDATRCPIRSDSFDCVDSVGGISNISGSHLAIREAYRILKPSGTLFMLDAEPDPESFAQLPDGIQNKLRESDPDMGTGYKNRLKNAGFEMLYYAETAGRKLIPGESALADTAAKYGIVVYLREFKVQARKPGG